MTTSAIVKSPYTKRANGLGLPMLVLSTAVLGPVLKAFYDGFFHGPYRYKRCLKGEKTLRSNLSEDQVDHMVEDSFPASDPPSNY